ncbi:MAG: class I SAM-dependent methyltransferase [Candidatus Woesearchaeota archaeon]
MSRITIKNKVCNANKKVVSKNYYDCISNGYEELYKQEQIKKLLIVKGLLNLKKEDSLLDVGSGIGLSAEIFDCKITMLDNSRELLRVAESKILDKSRIDLVLGKAEKMPFNNEKFDAAICITAMHNFSSPSKALREIRRVTKKKKGNIVISVLKKSKKREKIIKLFERCFKIKKIVDEINDLIFCLERKE